jgi:hypothetical protein
MGFSHGLTLGLACPLFGYIGLFCGRRFSGSFLAGVTHPRLDMPLLEEMMVLRFTEFDEILIEFCDCLRPFLTK